MAFLRHGCRVSAICPPGHPLRFVEGLEAVHTYRSLDSLHALRHAIETAKPDLIVPCDDGVVWQLHDLHARVSALRPLIEYSLGPAESYPTIRSRGAFMETAQALGLRIPETQTIASEEELEAWPLRGGGVLKLDGTWGGSGVVVVRSRTEALAAYRRLAKPAGASVVLKRLLVNHDPLAAWSLRGRSESTVSIQQFISGRPANIMMACWNGKVLASVSVEALAAQGLTGAATVVRIIDNPEIGHAASRLAAHFGLTGFHGLDFVIEDETGDAYLIELNPRSTQLGHLRLPHQGDLAGAIAAQLGIVPLNPPAEEDCSVGSTIAFFPQTFTWNPKSPYLRTAYHDVPWEQPALVRELMRKFWPERQPLYRLYHYFRPHRRGTEANFDETSSKAIAG